MHLPPQESAPFAVIGSNTVVEAKGQRVRGRLYPWGIVEGESRPGAQHWGGKAPLGWRLTHRLPLPTVENQAHCDFVKLRNMLIRTHMHDLKDVTCDVHYENYRAHCIQQMTRCVTHPPSDLPRPPPRGVGATGYRGSAQPPAAYPWCPPCSKLTQDSRMESPIPILPLPTPDAETEKLIRMKDEEVGRQQGRSRGWGWGQGQARPSPITLLTPPSVVPAPPP